MEEFKGSVSLEIYINNEDVRRYLDGRILELQLCVVDSYDLQKEIKTKIIKAVDGIYVSSYIIR